MCSQIFNSFLCRYSLSESVNRDPLLVLVLQKLVGAPVHGEPDLTFDIGQTRHSEWESRDGKLALILGDLLVINVDIETLLGMAAGVSSNDQDTLIVNLA